MITPIKRVGGKVKLAPWIISHLPDHNRYVECFGGSGAVLLSKPRIGGLDPAEVLNELDPDIANLFRVIQAYPCELAYQVEYTPYSRMGFELACEYIENQKGNEADAIKWACEYLVYNRQSFGGKGGKTWCISRRGENPVHTWNKLPEVITRVSERLHNTVIETLDYHEILRKYDSEETCFYLDPPYEGVEDRYYAINKESGFDHSALREELEDIQGSVVVSYYKSDNILKMYTGFEISEHATSACVGSKKKAVTEVLLIRPSAFARRYGFE